VNSLDALCANSSNPGRPVRLAAQGRPMGLIAAELGYASPSAFSAMVRRAVGQPPSRFFATA